MAAQVALAAQHWPLETVCSSLVYRGVFPSCAGVTTPEILSTIQRPGQLQVTAKAIHDDSTHALPVRGLLKLDRHGVDNPGGCYLIVRSGCCEQKTREDR